MMDNISQKKWTYLSFALMGIIASGILVPTAFAASPTLNDLMNKILGIDTKVTHSTIELQTSNSITGETGFTLLPKVAGKAYVGHLDIAQFGSAAIDMSVQCNNSDGTVVIGRTDPDGSGEHTVSTDFVCEEIDLHVSGGTGTLELSGGIDYIQTNTTQKTTLS